MSIRVRFLHSWAVSDMTRLHERHDSWPRMQRLVCWSGITLAIHSCTLRLTRLKWRSPRARVEVPRPVSWAPSFLSTSSFSKGQTKWLGSFKWVMCLIHMSVLSHSCEWYESFIWRSLKALLKVQDPYHGRALRHQPPLFPWGKQVTWLMRILSRRRLDFDICISRSDGLPVYSFEWRALPFTDVKTCLKFWGLPWKIVWIFGSSNNLKSDLLRPWERGDMTDSYDWSVWFVCVK